MCEFSLIPRPSWSVEGGSEDETSVSYTFLFGVFGTKTDCQTQNETV